MITIHNPQTHEDQIFIYNQAEVNETRRKAFLQFNSMNTANKCSILCGMIFMLCIMSASLCFIEKCWNDNECTNCPKEAQVSIIVGLVVSLLFIIGCCCKK